MTFSKMSILFFIPLTCLVTLGPCRAQNSQQDYLIAHNVARNAVGVVNLTWSATLANCATSYVQSRLSNCDLVHSNGPYGENLAKGSGSFTGSAAVKLWTDEKSCYVYSSNTCLAPTATTCKYGCLHYTQVVWRESTQVGCARLQCNNGWWFVSCNYNPPGNYEEEKPY